MEAETTDDRANEMTETTTIKSGLWSYRGWYIRRIKIGAQVGIVRSTTMYEINDDLKEMEECIGFPRLVSLEAAKARIRELTKTDYDRVQQAGGAI